MLEEQVGSASNSPERRSIDTPVFFGPFVLDRVERTLRRRGIEIALPERSLRLLEVLVRSAGQTVSKDRLVEEGWQGTYVSDTSLTEAISRLRTALGDEARRPSYIRTVHRRGYRFIAQIRGLGDRSGIPEPSKAVWMPVSIAASVALIGVLWVASVVVDGNDEPNNAAGFSAESLPAAFDLLQGLAGFLPGVAAPDSRLARPRFRLAEVTMNGGQLSRYRIPALPLNDLSVDRAGNRLAFSITDGRESDVWVFEPRKGELERVASGGFSDPVWTPNGLALAMAHSRNGSFDLVLKEADRDGPVQVLLEAPLDQFPESWSRDGRSLVYSERHPETGYDLWLLRQRSDDSWVPTPLVRTPADEFFGAISPDGRYVAFVSRTGQRRDVLVADLTSDRTAFRVSRDGGAYPFWSPTGDRLHYVKGNEVWTAAADQIGGDVTRAFRTSTTVAGLYLAGSASSADRFVVAMLDSAAVSATVNK